MPSIRPPAPIPKITPAVFTARDVLVAAVISNGRAVLIEILLERAPMRAATTPSGGAGRIAGPAERPVRHIGPTGHERPRTDGAPTLWTGQLDLARSWHLSRRGAQAYPQKSLKGARWTIE